ncbi:MAG: translocation/assembly module TamB [Bacteroidales bacterium]|nr:translocation/assembly module TamB [Bacteroidales bacterium]
MAGKSKIRKVFTALWVTVAVVPILLVGAVTAFLASEKVQTFVAQKVSETLSEKTGTEISVSKVFINLLRLSVDFKDVYVADNHHDTLLYAGSIEARLKSFGITQNYYNIGQAQIRNVWVNMLADSSGVYNYDFLFPSDTTDVDTVKSDTKFHIAVGKLMLSNINFRFVTKPQIRRSPIMDFDDLQLSGVNLLGKNFSINEKTEIHLQIDSLSAKEHCGFELRKLAAEASVSPKGILLRDLLLRTPNTDLRADSLNFHINDFGDFSDFCNKVVLGAKINEGSWLGVDDIGRFAEPLYGYGISPKISTEVSGPVCGLKIRKLKLAYLNDTRLSADADIQGLPNIDKTFFNLNIKELSTTQDNINTLHQPLSDEPIVELPDALRELGIVNFTALVEGTTRELMLNGNLTSNLGSIITDVALSTQNEVSNIQGIITARKLNLGAVTGDRENFGFLSTADTVNINIANDGSVNGTIKGEVDSIGLLGYTYSGININGKFSEQDFDGLFSIKDPNLDLDFAGLVNFGGDLLKAKCSLLVSNADLKTTHILNDSIDNLYFSLAADLEGSDIDNINGNLILTEPLVFRRDDKVFTINEFRVKAFIDQYICGLPLRWVELRSDYVDADVNGLVRSDQLARIMSNFAYMVLPSLNYEDTAAVSRAKQRLANNSTRRRGRSTTFNDPDFQRNLGNNFAFSILFKNPSPVTDFFIPELYISDNTTLKGGFSTMQSHIYTDLLTDSLKYNDYCADNLSISVNALGRDFILDINADSLDVSKDLRVKNPAINITARNDTASYMVSWFNTDSVKNEGTIDGSVILQQHYLPSHFPIIKVNFNQGSFYVLNSKWDIHQSTVEIDSTNIDINKFGLFAENQQITLNGIVSADPNKNLAADILNFDLGFLNKFVDGLNIKGVLSGNTDVKNLYGDIPLFRTHNTIENLVYNDVSLGNVTAKCDFQPVDSIINLEIFTKRRLLNKELMDKDTIKPIHGYGTCNIQTKEIDFTLNILSLPFNTFRPFYENYIKSSNYTNLSGYARVKGKIEDPKVMAQLSVHGGNFRIMSLGTQYDINDSLGITLDNNYIKIHKTTLYSDRKSGSAILQGTISHHNFEDIDMNLSLAVKNFMFLNAKQTDTSLFYGKAYASGNIFLRGNPMRMIDIDGRVKTEKNTLVYLPMYGASDVDANNEFMTFVTHDTLQIQNQRHGADLSGLKMNFNLEVTPDAEVQVILDETTGNILKASANGDLRLVISSAGDFSMFGTLAVEKGDYLFTMQNVISKKFEVVKGGTLRWNGDPMDAVVDISAVYKLRRVNLFNLMVDEEYRNKKVPVQCLLNMKGDLNEPIVSFGVKLDGNYDDIQTQLSNLDEGNINKQVISLLLFSQFQPLPGLQNQENSLFSDFNAGELVTNQINHWLSDISDKVDVGVNYSLGDQTTSSELEVALSTQLFDDRVTVSTNVGVGGESKTTTSNRTNNVVGEVEVDVNLNKSGTVKLKVYNKANDDELDQAPYTQGVGVSFKKEFNNRHDLFARKKKQKIKTP